MYRRTAYLHVDAVELIKASPGTTLSKATKELAHELQHNTSTANTGSSCLEMSEHLAAGRVTVIEEVTCGFMPALP